MLQFEKYQKRHLKTTKSRKNKTLYYYLQLLKSLCKIYKKKLIKVTLIPIINPNDEFKIRGRKASYLNLFSSFEYVQNLFVFCVLIFHSNLAQ